MSTNEVKPFHFRQCTEMSSSWREGRRQRMIVEMDNHDNQSGTLFTFWAELHASSSPTDWV